MNLPIYRAKKIDSDEYVEGYYSKINETSYILLNNPLVTCDISNQHVFNKKIEINPSTLAISFSDMIDSEGNKIFASLSEDDKGGDICNIHTSISKCEAVFYYDEECQAIRVREKSLESFTWEYSVILDFDGKSTKKVTGIQE